MLSSTERPQEEVAIVRNVLMLMAAQSAMEERSVITTTYPALVVISSAE